MRVSRCILTALTAGALACSGGGPDADGSDDPSDPPSETGDPSLSDDTGADTDTGPPEVGTVEATLASGGVQVCDNPSQRLTGPWDLLRAREQELAETGEYRLEGGALGVADLDGDGWHDVFLPGIREVQLHIGSPTGFVDEAVERLGDIDLTRSTAVSVVDIEGDGDLDLLVVRWERSPVLLINDGDGYFTDGTAEAGLAGLTGMRSQAAAFGDMDMDGDLDLFIGNYGPKPEDAFANEEDFEVGDPSWLLENTGDGTFLDVSDLLPPEVQDAHTFIAGFYDVDGDLRPELSVVNDFGWARESSLFWNTEAGLVRDDGVAGFGKPFAGMGVAIADLNDDGQLDMFQSSWRESMLLLSQGDLWFDVAQSKGVWPDWEGPPAQIFGWGAEFGDLDNDGDEDLVVNYGHWDQYGPQKVQRDAVYIQDAQGDFSDQAMAWGLGLTRISRGLLLVDLNNDGWLDVLKRVLDDRTPMYVSRCGERAWLRVKLQAPAPNTWAVGARVEIEDDGERFTRWIVAGGHGMYSGLEPQAHIGLADRDTVETLRIVWPDGETSVFHDVDTRQILTVTRDG